MARVSSATISYGPMESCFPSEVDAIANSLYKKLDSNPQELIMRLSKLMIKYPNIPILTNWLITAHKYAESDETIIDDLIKESYARFPEYLFAKIAYARLCYKNNEWQRIPKIFGNVWLLEDLYPEQEVFHITEATAFYHCMGLYHCYAGGYEAAENHIQMLRELIPENTGFADDLELQLMRRFFANADTACKKLARRYRSRALALVGKVMTKEIGNIE